MKMIDVARTAESKIAEIERSEIAEIARFVDAVFSFVVAVASIAYLIDLRFDVLIVSIAISIAVKQINVSAFVLKTVKMIICWLDEIVFNFDAENFLNQYFRFLFCCCLVSWRIDINHLMQIFFFITFSYFFRCSFETNFFFQNIQQRVDSWYFYVCWYSYASFF